MDLRQLRYFLATVQHGSFGRAAEALHVTQPALSKAVRQLERDLGVQLLDRMPRGVRPTTFGEALAVRADLINEEMERAKAAVAELRDGMVGRVIIGAGSSMRIDLLPRACQGLLTRVPAAKIKVVASLYDDLIPDLKRGSLDLVLSMIPDYAAEPDLVYEPLYYDQNHPCVRPGHPLLSKKTIKGEDFTGYQWILPTTSNLPRQHLDAAFHARGLPPPVLAVETNSSAFAARMIERSDLIGLLPTQIIIEDPRKAIIALPAPEFTMRRTVGITYRRATVLSPISRMLIAELHRAGQAMVEMGIVQPLGPPTPDS